MKLANKPVFTHLKLLAKLHRMQFGRKSEKIQRQIEQLELRLEELESKSQRERGSPATTGSHRPLFDAYDCETRTPRPARSPSSWPA